MAKKKAKPMRKEKPWVIMEGDVAPRPTTVTLRPRNKDAGWRLVFDRTHPTCPDTARFLFDDQSGDDDGILFDVTDLDYLGQMCIVMAAEMERQGIDPR